MKHIYISILSVIGLAACGAPTSNSILDEAWDQSNNPAKIAGINYEADFSKLPLKGDADHKGWSDSYWPTYRGGIGYRWQTEKAGFKIEDFKQKTGVRFTTLSPAEKYDVLLNDNSFPTLESERVRTLIMKTIPAVDGESNPDYVAGYEIPGWEGLCHGWAPAALNFQEPTKSVTRKLRNGNSVTFYPADIKALLTYYQQEPGNRSTRTDFVSQRCNDDFKALKAQLDAGEITRAQYNSARESSACRDMNAASLHILLANEIGVKKTGFVVDVTRDIEVWNQPVNSYRSNVVSESDKASVGAAPGTVKEVTIRTRMKYSVEVDYNKSTPANSVAGVVESYADYEYVLELDGAGKIIGGRWISEDRPDFAWRESTPEFQGHFGLVKSIYEASY
ncbi:MAG TPA: hypothetical protein VFO10_10765 [Oligoflexus sp.]|uniref:hypothetical protein n=1 Tax=Oligoflexus sp. TaxID=1971216 RepID=UPI002D7EEDF3|nr:hypothetical protein [Oligoflexus sp.]HET9237725.1 hypothetical protein [Oligoflexus sp.]